MLSDPGLYADIERMREVIEKHRQLKKELDCLHKQLESLLS
jgi:hypothetical protein